MRSIGIPYGKGNMIPFLLELEFQLIISAVPPNVNGGTQLLLVDAGLAEGREQDKVLLSGNLHVDVFIIVTVHCRCGKRVAHPHVDGVGFLLQGYAREWDGSQGLREERRVFMAQIVILCRHIIYEMGGFQRQIGESFYQEPTCLCIPHLDGIMGRF
jgi:hypothetical protein